MPLSILEPRKWAVLVGEIFDDSELRIIGKSNCSSRGVRKGVITDLSAASDCIHTTIVTAEKNAKRYIDEFYLSQTGSHLKGTSNVGTANVSSSDGIVGKVDIGKGEGGCEMPLSAARAYLYSSYTESFFSWTGNGSRNHSSVKEKRVEVGLLVRSWKTRRL